MSTLPFVALFALPAHAAEWFYPGPGPARAVWTDDGTVGDVPMRPTGEVVARLADPSARLPGALRVAPLRGDGRTVRIVPAPGVDAFALSRALHDRPDVAWAHPDFALTLVPHAIPDDPYLADQWHLDNVGIDGSMPGVDVRAFGAWDITNGAGGLVAVLDSGVDTDHPDLIVTSGHDYIDDDDDANPTDNGHGTSAAGLSAAVGDNGVGVAGVAWGAEVYAIRLIGGETTTADIRDALVEAVDAGATVLNNSWGYGEGCPTIPYLADIDDGLEYAEEQGRGGLGAVVVFSAGNGGCDMGNNWMLDEETVVSVGASSRTDRLEGYSSYGAPLDIVAPSGGVLTTDIAGEGGYGDFEGDQDYTPGFSGTSASAPIVSGVFALMFAANPDLTAAEARQVVCETATRIDLAGGGYDESGWSPYYGCGRIDAEAAVSAVANSLPGAVTITGPVESAFVENVVLTWTEAVDADGDPVSYRVSWTPDTDDNVEVVVTDVPWLDLTGQVDVGAYASWKVVPVDAWGRGPESEVAHFRVSATPAPPADTGEGKGGCQVAPAGGLLGALLGLLAVPRRRR